MCKKSPYSMCVSVCVYMCDLPEMSGANQRGSLNSSNTSISWHGMAPVFCGFLNTKVDMTPLRIHKVCGQIPHHMFRCCSKHFEILSGIRNCILCEGGKNHHHFEIKSGMESSVTRSERERKLHGRGKQEEVGEGSHLHRRRGGQSFASSWRGDYSCNKH